ncbi:hypothetical protein TNCV_3958291 [Trichonephila clavipes]|nr:hypothetical protein TNCV_3958291 [Trichonephila clavipes]
MLVRLTPAETLHVDGLIPTVKLGLFCDDVWGNILPRIGTSRCLEGDDHIRQLSKHYCRSSSPCASDIPSERLLFQKDSVPVHTTNCLQTWLQEHDDEVVHLTWCPLSIDLNIVECLLGFLENYVCVLRSSSSYII